jgi:hypothetical protein
MTDGNAPTCGSALRVTATATVPCALHAQHDVVNNDEPASHQGAYDGKIYIWQTRDAYTLMTLRNAGFHAQCDDMARKLTVDPRLVRAVSG